MNLELWRWGSAICAFSCTIKFENHCSGLEVSQITLFSQEISILAHILLHLNHQQKSEPSRWLTPYSSAQPCSRSRLPLALALSGPSSRELPSVKSPVHPLSSLWCALHLFALKETCVLPRTRLLQWKLFSFPYIPQQAKHPPPPCYHLALNLTGILLAFQDAFQISTRSSTPSTGPLKQASPASWLTTGLPVFISFISFVILETATTT